MVGFLVFVSVIAAMIIPTQYIDAVRKIRDKEDALINQIVLGLCSGVIMFTVLMIRFL